jgi:hypothetical protein
MNDIDKLLKEYRKLFYEKVDPKNMSVFINYQKKVELLGQKIQAIRTENNINNKQIRFR